MTRNDLLKSISQKVSNYRLGEIDTITPSKVNRWVSQFEDFEQLVILEEIDNILNQCYFSRDRIKSSFKEFLKNKEIVGFNVKEGLVKLDFIHIQKQGNSQREMLELVDEILQEDYNLNINKCGGYNLFLYIDDCIFSGNRFKYDILDWLGDKGTPPNSILYTYHVGIHQNGFNYAYKNIKSTADKKNIKVNSYAEYCINDNRSVGSNIDILWPKEYFNKDIKDYWERLIARCDEKGWNYPRFRDFRTPSVEGLFSTAANRDIVEKAFLRVGAKLIMAADNPAPSMRPLGFEKLESLGFGSPFITYRNIANNCPLALWYGDPDNFPETHPFGSWYPLFPRRTNHNDFSNTVWGEDLFVWQENI